MLQEIRAVWLLLSLGILLATIEHGNAERKIVCYYTNWSVYRPGTAKFSPQNINPYLCTHLIYAFGGFTKDNTLKPFDKYQDIEKGGYAKFTGLKTYNKNLKTMLAIGGWNEGSSRFSPMVADAGRRRELVKNAVKFLRLNHFDGLDLDWEYPVFRDGGKPRDKDNYANLVQELREEFERESSKTGRPRLLLSMAMPAGIEYIDKGYDIPRLNEYLDFINLLSYDYHSAYEPAVNHHSPLYPLEEDNEYNYDTELTIDYTIKYLLQKGASAKKIILGIPTYGRSYTLFNEDATDLGAPADGPGVQGDATREKGYLAYYEICENIAESDDWEVVQPNPNAMGPYAFKGNQWVGYDDEDIVRLKAKYVNERNLGGIMFWSIDNDDFRGKCHGRAYPLIEAAKEALLTDSSRNAIQKSKPLDPRKKNRLHGSQSNAIGRKLSSGGRTSTTTVEPVTRKRIASSRPRYRTIQRFKSSEEDSKEKEEDEERDKGYKEVDRRSYNAPSNEEDDEGGNVVRHVDKSERSRPKIKTKPRNRSNRRKQSRRDQEKKESSVEEESLSNKLTTPEPPTTPDPGSDFKCEDEGFFSHPRDCKKYFWCLDSGPGGLGIVGHQFTCPSGLVFNKAADSCDYPRNVVCPKSKGSQSTGSTTRAPVTAATSRTTYLHSTTHRPTTEKAASYEREEEEEEYEYYDDEQVEDESDEERKTTTTPKPLLYKTINRIRSTTANSVAKSRPTEESSTATLKPDREQSDKVSDFEDEEDPKVIKELLDLIKKAGGIEQLEKQLLFQDKRTDSSSNNERVTPATISRTLYERVLSRQATRLTNNQRTTSGKNTYANGPGGAQFEGLDDIPEVKNFRRYQKPQYVNIERAKASTREPPVQDEEIEDEEELDEDNTDVASSEEQSISNPFLSSSTQRTTPNYVNIRRARPSTTTSRSESIAEANDEEVEEEEEEEEEEPVRRRRPGTLYKDEDDSESAEPVRKRVSSLRNAESNKGSEDRVKPVEDETPTTKSRYVNIQRFRSTTVKSSEDISTENTSSPATPESITSTAATSTLEAIKFEKEADTSTVSSTSPQTTTAFSSSSTDIADSVLAVEPLEQTSSITSVPEGTSTVESLKLVEDSATEILLTTVPASSSQTISSVSSSTSISSSSTKITEAAVFQPRPFGFNRRTRPTTTTTTTTTPLPPSKVDTSGSIKLPTLKELVAYQSNDYTATTSSPVQLSLLPVVANNRLEFMNIQAPNPSMQQEAPPNARSFLENDYDSLAINVLYGIKGKGRETAQGTSARKERVFVFPDLTQERNNIQNNIENDIDDAAATNGRRKTRIDHAGSSTSTVKPTTMRGTPVASFTSKENPRGFYVTKSVDDAPSLTGRSRGKETTEKDFEQATENYLSESTVEDLTDSTTSFLEDEEKSTTLVVDDTVDDRFLIVDQTTESFHESLVTEFFATENTETTEMRYTTMTTDLAAEEPLTEPATRNSDRLGSTNQSISRGTSRSRIRSRNRSRSRNRGKSTTTDPVREQSSVSRVTEQTEGVTIQSKSSSTGSTVLLETTTSKEVEFTASSTSNINSITTVIECSNMENVTTTECLTTTESVIPTPSFHAETSSTYEIVTGTEESTIAESSTAVLNSVTPRISELTESSTEKIPSTMNPITDSMTSVTGLDVDATTFLAALDLKSTESFLGTERYVTKEQDNSTNAKAVEEFTTTTSKAMESTIGATIGPTIGGVVESTTEVAVSKSSESTETKTERRRQRVRVTPSNYGFGEKTLRRTSVRRSNVTAQETPRESTRNQSTRSPRRRVSVYRGRKRRPNTSTTASTTENLDSIIRQNDTETEEKVIVGEYYSINNNKTESTKTFLSTEREESLDVEETGNGIIEKGGLVEKEVTLEQEERPVTEVNLREPGSSAIIGVRKLGSSKPTSSVTQNRSTSGLTNHRRNRPSETTNIPKSTIDKNFDTTEKVTNTTERSEKSTKQESEVSDQSSKAQELAVTLAEPPSPQTSSTGRSPLRDALKRKISTTIAPRIDTTTTKSTTRFGQVFRNRQRAKPKDSPLVQKVTSRPRRPQVVDYDYYEDEEEPVVGKSGFNGKLYLTSKGSIRCLDQGNFPHPNSCNKFITCARMVNGQVIGTEYTCPDKLSFDPVGGICNWSAGLGCKE